MSTNSSPSKSTVEGELPNSLLPQTKCDSKRRPPPKSAADEESATAEEETTAAEDEVLAPANEPHPPPRFTWARPLMQGYKGRINQYVRDEVVEHVRLTLEEVGGEEAIERFKEGPFGHFLDLRIGNSANNALHELMAHELEDATFSEQERWFHIGGTDIVFTAPNIKGKT
ncbi:uncharacterized protein LOC131026166 [Salvia miltiorrhiza]|uniref:uncharacterized protein LOC131026166 n=1 Tax=Salvia miltiorrhiza TaxID=226208 RepID=UPI0025ACEEF4|nr:uncharacterized protein LOC131026166 [Salvia miltiorrhiza]